MDTTEHKMTILEQLPPGLTEQQVLDQAFEIMRQQQSLRTARYYFYYDEDYASDLVTAYFYAQRIKI
jgi:hypothetical protein